VVIIRILKWDEHIYLNEETKKKLDPATKNSKLESYLFIFCINFNFNFKFNLKFVVVVVFLFKQVQLYLRKNFNYNNGLIIISKLNIKRNKQTNKQVFIFCRIF
jgi:hypothetical protein